MEQLIEQLSNAFGVSGQENEVRQIFSDELNQKLGQDNLGGLFAKLGNEGPKVMLTAHMDEIGFMVQSVQKNGFINFVAVGGWWSHSLPSQRVKIKNMVGEKILGIIGTKPPHFLPEEERKKVMPIDSMYIDIGADSAEEVLEDYAIKPGCFIVPDSTYTPLGNNGKYTGKALDNRLGVCALIEATKNLKKEDLPCNLYSVATVQEEVGLRGAQTMTTKILPDVAIILEGPPADDTPGFDRATAQGQLQKGVQIRLMDPTAIMNQPLANLIEQTAKEAGIPCQVTVRKSGGTDAGQIQLKGSGVPVVVLGVPARYIHSHNSVFHIDDLKAMVQLIKKVILKLDSQQVKSFTDFVPEL
ncbi:MAG: M42 family metallopeptidase [Lentisphaeria bacterium]|nr:M42 family metallopeptidase [Lentisphaeria bacterium]